MADDWTTVAIRKAVVDKINKFLKTKEAKENGYTNSTAFVDEAVRDMLSKYELKRFEHFNFHDNIIRVLDNSLGTRGDIVELRRKNNHLLCGYCEEDKCVHVKFAWSDVDLASELKKAGLRSPF
jgi:hypothetical protein